MADEAQNPVSDVPATGYDPIPSPEEVQKLRKAEKELRAQEVAKQIDDLIKKHNCYIDVYLTVGSDGSMKGEFNVKAL